MTATLDDILKAASAKNGGWPSEDELATGLVEAHCMDFCHVTTWGRWAGWTVTGWEVEQIPNSAHAARLLCRDLLKG
ncbi:MAG: hypothetical protein M3Z96_13040 [Pseudomonadota bacterium]|nr:hypothetical protein [Pseudomonadota bacterium]